MLHTKMVLCLTLILLAVKVTASAVVKKKTKKLKKFRRDRIQTLTSALSKIDLSLIHI